MARLLIDSGGTRRVYEILEDRLTVGRDPGNQVRLRAPDVASCHLVLSRRSDGYVVQPCGGAASIRVNGQEVEERALRHGDRIQIGDVTLVYLDRDRLPEVPSPPRPAAPTAPAAPAAPPSLADLADQAAEGLGVRRARPRRADHRRAARARSWPMASAALLLSVAAIYLVVQIAGAGAFGKSAISLVNLAESQAARGALEAALDTLGMARERDPDADTLRRIEALEKEVSNHIARRSDQGLLSRASAAYQLMKKFEQVYLRDDPTARPAARELVRMADDWLASYAETCARYPEYDVELQGVHHLRDTYAGAAALDQPDTVADTLFRARTRVRLKNRRYREAIAILDERLATASAEDRKQLDDYRQELRVEGADWLRHRLEEIREMLRAGYLEDAERALGFLRREGLPEWEPQLSAVASEIAAARR